MSIEFKINIGMEDNPITVTPGRNHFVVYAVTPHNYYYDSIGYGSTEKQALDDALLYYHNDTLDDSMYELSDALSEDVLTKLLKEKYNTSLSKDAKNLYTNQAIKFYLCEKSNDNQLLLVVDWIKVIIPIMQDYGNTCWDYDDDVIIGDTKEAYGCVIPFDEAAKWIIEGGSKAYTYFDMLYDYLDQVYDPYSACDALNFASPKDRKKVLEKIIRDHENFGSEYVGENAKNVVERAWLYDINTDVAVFLFGDEFVCAKINRLPDNF